MQCYQLSCVQLEWMYVCRIRRLAARWFTDVDFVVGSVVGCVFGLQSRICGISGVRLTNTDVLTAIVARARWTEDVIVMTVVQPTHNVK